MKKLLIVFLAICSLFVSCATSKVEETSEKASFFVEMSLKEGRIFIVDNPKLREVFDKFNAELFDNEIAVDYIGFVKPSKMVTRDGVQCYGYALYYSTFPNSELTYGIALVPNYSKGTLIHEMTHLYFNQKGYFQDCHGKYFCDKIDELNKKTNYKYTIPKN